jgi:hypothetical protein
MDLFHLEYWINRIVLDLQKAENHRYPDPDTAWREVRTALDSAKEMARALETTWGDGGDEPS